MKRILLWLIVAAAVVIGFVFYRSRSGSHLNVTPDAEREIEKGEAALIVALVSEKPQRNLKKLQSAKPLVSG